MAEVHIEEKVGPILSRSRDHWTEPWGFKHKDMFLNKALIVQSVLEPDRIMEECLLIERSLGRTRSTSIGYGPRPIDIDILLIEDLIHSSQDLQIPHPRMHERSFALAPAADIAPSWIHPELGIPLLQLLNKLH